MARFDQLPYIVLDANGDTINDATVEFYQDGTTTPVTVYSDEALSTSIGTSVGTNSSGQIVTSGDVQTDVYVAAGTYKIVVKDADGVSLATYDNLFVRETRVFFQNVAAIIADTKASYPTGTIIESQDGGYRYEVAASGATDQHVTTAGGVKLYHLQNATGNWFIDALGASGDGSTDDSSYWQTAIARVPNKAKLTFTPGKTYLMSAGNDYRNDSTNSDLTTAKDIHIVAYGATLKLKNFTGSEFLFVNHYPSGSDNGNPWTYEDFTFTWEGGTLDCNGQNQNFRHAAELRDGTGTIDPTFTGGEATRAQTEADNSPTVFGADGYWEINASSTSTEPTDGGSAIQVKGAAYSVVRDVTIKNGNDVGFDFYLCCGPVVFENCRAENYIPTNDQWVINYINGGAGPGSQAVAFKVNRPRTRAILKVTLNGETISAGNELEGATTGLVAQVHSVDGSTIYIYDLEGDEAFQPGEVLKIGGVTSSATATWMRVDRQNELTWDKVTGVSGNTLGAVIATGSAGGVQYGTIANVSNCSGIDQGTCTFRFESVHTLNIDNYASEYVGIQTDPTKTLHYGSQAGLNASNGCIQVNIQGLLSINGEVSGGPNNRGLWTVDGVRVLAKDASPVTDVSTGNDAMINGWSGAGEGRLTNIHIESVATTGGGYAIDTAIDANRATLSDFYVNGCVTGLSALDRVYNGVILNSTDYAATNGGGAADRPGTWSNIDIRDCEKGVYIAGAAGVSTNISMNNIRFRTIQQNCFVLIAPNFDVANISDCVFEDFGLDTGQSDALRAAVGGSGGIDPDAVILRNCTWIKQDANCSLYMTYQNGGGCDQLINIGAVYYPHNTAFVRSGTGFSDIEVFQSYYPHFSTTNTNAIPSNSNYRLDVKLLDGTQLFIPAFTSAW